MRKRRVLVGAAAVSAFAGLLGVLLFWATRPTPVRAVFDRLQIGEPADAVVDLLAELPAGVATTEDRTRPAYLVWEGRTAAGVRQVYLRTEQEMNNWRQHPVLAKARGFNLPKGTTATPGPPTVLVDPAGRVYGKLLSHGLEQLEVYYLDGVLVEKTYYTDRERRAILDFILDLWTF
jgi:hypothetical protein